LLEVGTGFHPELTGRENIYLNGAILGMKRIEIDRKFEEIVEFSEISKFIDTPVKHYSSGMYIRLAFAVAAHLEPEVLIVDEVLAVGDFSFQKKCLGRMHDLGLKGRTVILVTHNMSALSTLCHRGIMLQEGEVQAEGEIQTVVKKYLRPEITSEMEWLRGHIYPPDRGLCITTIRAITKDKTLTGEFPSNEPCIIEITYKVYGLNVQSRIIIELETEEGVVIFTTTDRDMFDGVDTLREPGVHTCRCILPPHLLAPGTYYITACASWTARVEWDRVSRALMFRVSRVGSLYVIDNRPGVVAPILNWEQLN
jgi:lipopolysaccharide transport system ATP-binding protein